MRKLASIRRILKLEPIEGADRIELAHIDGWQCVVQKGDFSLDTCFYGVYFEIDSFLPIKPQYEFLRKNCYRVMADGVGGFRIKTMKLRKVLSQGLLMPFHALKEFEGYSGYAAEGTDLTEMLGVRLYEPPQFAQTSGNIKGNFPYFIPKTDAERIQNLVSDWDKLKEHTYEVTEKLDGTSATFYINNGEFGVCSRNCELKDEGDVVYWRIAKQLNLEEKMRNAGINFAIQGEIVGEGIQGNPYKLVGQKLFVFDVYSIDEARYALPSERQDLSCVLNPVPLIQDKFRLDNVTLEDLLKMADGKSTLNDVPREGFVFKSNEGRSVFKIVSNAYLLGEKE